MDALTRTALRLLPALALVALAGCDTFRPQAAEPPIAPPCDADVAEDYSDPEGVLETIAEAIAAKDCGNGFQAYVAAFADSARDGVPFYALFADELVTLRIQAGLSVPVWNLPLERDFYRDFVRLYDEGYVMFWSDTGEGDDFPTPGEAILRRRYEVWAEEDGELLASIAVGYADISLRAVTETRWAIIRWADRIDPEVGVDPADPGQRSFGEWRLETQ